MNTPPLRRGPPPPSWVLRNELIRCYKLDSPTTWLTLPAIPGGSKGQTIMRQGPPASPREKKIAGGPEERRLDREPAIGFALRSPISGRIVDITAFGAGVESHSPLKVLDERPFTFGIGKSSATVRGEVRWCRLSETKLTPDGESIPIFRAGISFLDS